MSKELSKCERKSYIESVCKKIAMQVVENGGYAITLPNYNAMYPYDSFDSAIQLCLKNKYNIELWSGRKFYNYFIWISSVAHYRERLIEKAEIACSDLAECPNYTVARDKILDRVTAIHQTPEEMYELLELFGYNSHAHESDEEVYDD